MSLIESLNIPRRTLEALKHILLPTNSDFLQEQFFHNPRVFQDVATKMEDLQVLGLYLQWLDHTKAKYDSLGIPEEYFRDSMKDIAIWCDDYLNKHNSPGFREWAWVGRSLQMEVIRIGRLQFEPSHLLQDVTLHERRIPAGTPVLEVHIPAGEPLDTEEVLASMSRAPEFFRTYFGEAYSLFHCHSWLLCPSLKSLLPAGSRILRFQDLFTVYKTDNEERQAEERVFGFLSDDPQDYPETTSLQKALKQYLQAGNPITMGAGLGDFADIDKPYSPQQ